MAELDWTMGLPLLVNKSLRSCPSLRLFFAEPGLASMIAVKPAEVGIVLVGVVVVVAVLVMVAVVVMVLLEVEIVRMVTVVEKVPVDWLAVVIAVEVRAELAVTVDVTGAGVMVVDGVTVLLTNARPVAVKVFVVVGTLFTEFPP